MNSYIATFHTNLAAVRTLKTLNAATIKAKSIPVPRILSASCGSAVFYFAQAPMIECMARDTAAIFEALGEDKYVAVHCFADSGD